MDPLRIGHAERKNNTAMIKPIAMSGHFEPLRESEFPKELLLTEIIEDLKRLSAEKTRLESEISFLKQRNHDKEKVTEAQYSRFLELVKTQLHAMIHRVIVTKAGFEIQYFVGSDQIKKGSTEASILKSLENKNSVQRSFFLTSRRQARICPFDGRCRAWWLNFLYASSPLIKTV